MTIMIEGDGLSGGIWLLGKIKDKVTVWEWGLFGRGFPKMAPKECGTHWEGWSLRK